jgi:hypothetical protein
MWARYEALLLLARWVRDLDLVSRRDEYLQDEIRTDAPNTIVIVTRG